MNTQSTPLKIPRRMDVDILAACQLNAAITYTQLARKLNISVTTARQAILRLRHLGIIHKIVFIDYFALGYLHYQIYFQLRDDAVLDPEVWSNLESLPGLLWAGQITGDFKLGVTLCARNMPEFEQRLQKLEALLRGMIRLRILFPMTGFTYLQRRYQNEAMLDTAPRSLHTKATAHPPQLFDETDSKILTQLIKDPWLSEVELSTQINTPRQTIHQRLLRLEERGILLGTIYGVSAQGFGRRVYKLFLKLGGRTPAAIQSIATFLRRWPETATIVCCLGPWDLEVVVEVVNAADAHAKQAEILKEFADLVSEVRVQQVLDQTMSRHLL